MRNILNACMSAVESFDAALDVRTKVAFIKFDYEICHSKWHIPPKSAI